MKKHLLSFSITMCLLICNSYQSSSQAKATTLPQGNYKSIYEMLKEVPGLDVKLSNDKSGGSVTIRGIGSLRNQKEPLYVVDGMIYGGDITNINPQDVESISILKDAASATAYGAQGAAGVIIITYKKGGATVSQPSVKAHEESAYTYFIDHKTALKVYDQNDKLIIEGVILRQQDSSLVFIKKKSEVLVPIKNIGRVEMIPQ